MFSDRSCRGDEDVTHSLTSVAQYKFKYCIYFSHSKKICRASFRETFQWLKFPLDGLRAQSRVSPVVGLLTLASGPACLGMAFPPFLMKQLYRCDSVMQYIMRKTVFMTEVQTSIYTVNIPLFLAFYFTRHFITR